MNSVLSYVTLMVLSFPLLGTLSVPVLRRWWPRRPLAGSMVFFALAFIGSFFLLFAAADHGSARYFSWPVVGFGVYLDLLTAAALVIVSVVSLQTILCSPRLWSIRDGFVSFLVFSLSCLALHALILSDNLLVFLFFWALLDFGAFYGQEWEPERTKRRRMRAFLVLQAASLTVIASAIYLTRSAPTTNFAYLIAHKEVLSPPILTALMMVIFIGVGIKTAGFPFSFWAAVATANGSAMPQFPLIYGVSAVLPGIYLLTRLHPILEHTLVPIPLVLAAAVCVGFVVFPFFEPNQPETASE